MTRQQFNDYVTAAIALIVMAALFWYISVSKTSVELKELKQTQQQTQTKTKEVKEIETVYQTVVKQNDTIIQQKVKEACSTVPDDIDALINLANSIIRDSDKDKP